MLDAGRMVAALSLAFVSTGVGQLPPATQTKPAFDPQAVRILREAFVAYQKAQSYHDEATLTLVTGDGESQENKQLQSRMVFNRPNRFLFTWPSLSLFCDGREFQTYYPNLRQYARRPAPPVLTTAFLHDVMVEDFLTLVMSGLVSDTPYETTVRRITRLEYHGEVKENGKAYHELYYHEGSDQVTLWIEADRKVFSRITISPRQGNKGKWQLRVVYTSIELDPVIDPAAFTLTAPAGARQVDRISFTRDFDHPTLGQAFPGDSLAVLGSKEKTAVKSFLGSNLSFVTLWASWCPPCRSELPVLQSLYEKYRDWGFQVIGINLDQSESLADVVNVVKENRLRFPTFLDPESALAQTLMVKSIPSLFILDAKGIIREVHVGTSPNSARELEQVIQQAIKSRPAGTQPAK